MTNIAMISGRLTADIELKQSTSGTSYCRFTIANDEGYGDKKKTNFINCVAFGKTAEAITKYRGKGKLISVEGSLEMGKYKDKNGNDRTSYEISCRNIEWDWDSVPKDDGYVQPTYNVDTAPEQPMEQSSFFPADADSFVPF